MRVDGSGNLSCFWRGDRRQVIKYYDQALQEAPRKVRIWDNRGWALFELGRYEEGASSYARALEIEPSKVDTQIWQAYCLERLGRQDAVQLRGSGSDEIAAAWEEIGCHEFIGIRSATGCQLSL